MTTGRSTTTSTGEVLAQADRLVAGGRPLEAIDVLTLANRGRADPALERRLAEVRHGAFATLEPASAFDSWPPPVDRDTDAPAHIPEVTRDDLDAGVVRRGIQSHGSVCVRGLLDDEQVRSFVSGIGRALTLRGEGPDAGADRSQSWFAPLRVPPTEARTLGRHFVASSGGVLGADSPRLLFLLFESYADAGLHRVLTDYLGERPVLSANKCTMRRVPLTANTDWHQDGAFLGTGIRALNVWVALTDCGVDAPGMDLLPRRLDHLVETGTGGAMFDWSVGPEVVEALAVHSPVVRPRFRAGDALLFDDLFLHRTGIEPTMTQPRYALESWFFAPTSYPDGQVPLVW